MNINVDIKNSSNHNHLPHIDESRDINTTFQSGRFNITKIRSDEINEKITPITPTASVTPITPTAWVNVSAELPKNVYEIFDNLILNIFEMTKQVYSENINENNLPFHFEFNSNGTLQSVNIRNYEMFNEFFESKINILNLCNSNVKLPSSINNEHLNFVIGLVNDVNLLKHEIMKLFGGNLFPMFPECVGYVYNLYSSSLLKLEPHEFLRIDECSILKYFKYKLNKKMK